MTTNGGPKSTPEAGRLRLACSLGWKERATWRYRLSCRRRGIYQLGPAVVTSGDPFGFFPRSSKSGKTSRVVVYPKLIPLEQLGLPAGFPLGNSKPPLWIFEDPSRNVGVRDYRREDPFRRIHWKASARRQELQVKVHEPTTTLEVALFLAVDSFSAAAPGSDLQPPTIDHEAFEHAVSVAASVAHLLLQRRHPVGLYVNGGAADSRDPLILPPAGSREQLIRILEALAGVEPAPCLPMATLLAEVVPRLPWGSSVILVAGSLPDPLPASLQTLERMGRKPIVLAGRC